MLDLGSISTDDLLALQAALKYSDDEARDDRGRWSYSVVRDSDHPDGPYRWTVGSYSTRDAARNAWREAVQGGVDNFASHSGPGGTVNVVPVGPDSVSVTQRAADGSLERQHVFSVISEPKQSRKYSEDQPREPAGSPGGGRFASADGGDLGSAIDAYRAKYPDTVNPPPDPRLGITPEQVAAGRALGLFPETTPRVGSNLINGDPARCSTALAALDRLQTQFPGVKVEQVDMRNLAEGWGMTAREANSVGAMTAMGDVMLNEHFFGQNPADWPGSEMRPGWLVSTSIEGIATHEFGHVLDGALSQGLLGKDVQNAYVDWRTKAWNWPQGSGVIGSTDNPYRTTKMNWPPVSGYAQSDPKEAIAEIFTAAFTPGNPQYDNPAASSLRDVLTSTGVYQPGSATKYSEGQPREPAGSPEGGEFASTGGGTGPLEVPKGGPVSGYSPGFDPNHCAPGPLTRDETLYWVGASNATLRAIRANADVPGTLGYKMRQLISEAPPYKPERYDQSLVRGVRWRKEDGDIRKWSNRTTLNLPLTSFTTSEEEASRYVTGKREYGGALRPGDQPAFFRIDSTQGVRALRIGGTFGGTTVDEWVTAGSFRIFTPRGVIHRLPDSTAVPAFGLHQTSDAFYPSPTVAPKATKYSEDQPRDERGRFSGPGAGDDPEEYRINHRAPGPDNGAPMHDLSTMFPADVYDPRVQRQFYGSGAAPGDPSTQADAESFRAINGAQGKPDAPITVYRALPSEYATIHEGDWVTPSRTYAQMHLDGPLGGNGRIISATVPARTLFWNGDSINEFGYAGPDVATKMITKYSPDQPRDDHGRWAAGAGAGLPDLPSVGTEYAGPEYNHTTYNDAIAATAREASAAMAHMLNGSMAKYVEQRTGVPVILAGSRPNVAAFREGMAQFIALHDAFPNVPVKAIEVTPLRPSNLLARTEWSGYKPESVIRLSSARWAQKDQTYGTPGWFTLGNDNPAGTITHEFGHALDHAALFDRMRMSGDGTLKPGTPEYFRMGPFHSLPPISGYGATNDAERFAELFAATYAAPTAPPDQMAAMHAYATAISGSTLTKAASPLTFADKAKRVLRRAYVQVYSAARQAAADSTAASGDVSPQTMGDEPDEAEAALEGEDAEMAGEIYPGIEDDLDGLDPIDSLDPQGQAAVSDYMDQSASNLLGLATVLMGGVVTARQLDNWLGTYAAGLHGLWQIGFGNGVTSLGEVTTATWDAQDDAGTCPDCEALNGQVWTEPSDHPYPGDSPFGGSQRCGPMCRCALVYDIVPADEAPLPTGDAAPLDGGPSGGMSMSDYLSSLGLDQPAASESDYLASAAIDVSTLSVPELTSLYTVLAKYSDDEPRDARGEWTVGDAVAYVAGQGASDHDDWGGSGVFGYLLGHAIPGPVLRGEPNSGSVIERPAQFAHRDPPDRWVVYRGRDGMPVGVMRITTNAFMPQTPLTSISEMAVKPDERGKGYATAMYDWVQDHGGINLYGIIGHSRSFTTDGKAFAESWLQHRVAVEQARAASKADTGGSLAEATAALDAVRSADVSPTGMPSPEADEPVRKYSEDQPRDDHGRFTAGGASDVADHLIAGHHPTIRPDQVQAFMDHAATRTDNPDLTNLRVQGTLLFGGEGLGRTREEMPQLPSAMRQSFLDGLSAKGVPVTAERVDPRTLKPVQSEISARAAGQMLHTLQSGRDLKPFLVSRDNYVVDGHHGWAASVAQTFTDRSFRAPVIRIGMDHGPLLAAAEAWGEAQGVPHRALGDDTSSSAAYYANKFNPNHDERGRFAEADSGGASGWADPGERPAYGMPPDFESWPSDKQDRWFTDHRTARAAFDSAMARGVAIGAITPEAAQARGWDPNTGGRPIQPLPDVPLYHATVAMDAVLAHGLMTQDEMRTAGITSTGLGGGTTDTISLTTDKAFADRIAETIVESHDVATGAITVADLMARAQAGGFDAQTKDSYGRIKGNWDQQVVRGMTDGPNTISAMTPAEMAAKNGDLGWQPRSDSYSVTGSDGQTRYTNWERPQTADEVQQTRFDVYRSFLFSQSVAGGPTDPVFWAPDPKYYASLDTSQVGVVQATPNPGSMGYYQGEAEAEWRTWSGRAVTVSSIKAVRPDLTKVEDLTTAELIALRRVLKYSEDEPRDERGKWTSGAGSVDPATALSAWTGHATDGMTTFVTDMHAEIRQAAAGAGSIIFGPNAHPSVIGQAVKEPLASKIREHADTLLRAVAEAPVTGQQLVRGIKVTPEEAQRLLALKPGDKMDLNLSSWSSDPKAAASFTGNGQPSNPRLFLLLNGDKQAIPVGSTPLAWEREWITAGHFEVVGTQTRDFGVAPKYPADWGDRPRWQQAQESFVVLRQTGVFTEPSQAVGTKAASADLVKYSPDQPRDDHGRFAADGGGSDLATAGDPKATGLGDPMSTPTPWDGPAAAKAYFDAAHPGMVDARLLDPAKINWERVGPLLTAVDAAAKAFPEVAKEMHVGMKAFTKADTGGVPPKAVLGFTVSNLDKNGDPTWGSRIMLNSTFYGDKASLGWGDSPDNNHHGWFVLGTSNPQGTFWHEFGHAAQNWIIDTHVVNGSVQSDQSMRDSQVAMRNLITGQMLNRQEALSGYARSDGNEWFAEAFSAAYNPDSRMQGSPEASVIRNLMTSQAANPGPVSHKVVKFNPNHDERGRFASADSSGGAPTADDVAARAVELSGGPGALDPAFDAIVSGRDPARTLYYGPGLTYGNPASVLAAVNQIASLQTQFPGIMIREVTGGSEHPTFAAWYKPDQKTITLGDAAYVRDPAAFRALMDPPSGNKEAWLTVPTPEGTVAHEFGHAVSDLLLSSPDPAGVDLYKTIAAIPPVSGYSRVQGGDEHFAEVFSAAFTPGNEHYNEPYAITMRDGLKSLGIWQPTTATKYSEDEPRDDRGRWTADGGTLSTVYQTQHLPRQGAFATSDPTRLGNLPSDYKAAVLAKVAEMFPGATPETMVANLRTVLAAGLADPAIAAGKGWYGAAHAEAVRISAQTGYDVRTTTGAIAAMSPQHEWGSNVVTAEYVGQMLKDDPALALTDSQKALVQTEMDKRGITVPPLDGVHLTTLDPMVQASVIKAMGRDVPLRYPSDVYGDKMMKATWSCGLNGIVNAIDIYNGQDPNEVLGGHKVRSFFNNILTGDQNPGGFVTIDTHAISAALGQRDAAGNLIGVPSSDKNLGAMMSRPSIAEYGTKGAYPVFADAYRQVAAEAGLSPEQAQAIIWLEWRQMTKKGR